MTTADIDDQRDLAARAAGCADLVDIRLFESSSKLVEVVAADVALASDMQVEPTMTVEGDALVARVRFRVEITRADDDSPVAGVECTYGALYRLPSEHDLPRNELQAFSQSVGLLALYPYAREFTQTVTTRMGLPPLVLPILRQAIPQPEVFAVGKKAAAPARRRRAVEAAATTPPTKSAPKAGKRAAAKATPPARTKKKSGQ
jgi:preprotein translocase subunit SecB